LSFGFDLVFELYHLGLGERVLAFEAFGFPLSFEFCHLDFVAENPPKSTKGGEGFSHFQRLVI